MRGGLRISEKKLKRHIDEGTRNMHTKFQQATTIRTCKKIGGTKALDEEEERRRRRRKNRWKHMRRNLVKFQKFISPEPDRIFELSQRHRNPYS